MNTIQRFWPAAMLLAFFFAAATIVVSLPDEASQTAAPQSHIQTEDDEYDITADTDTTLFYVRTPDGHTYFRDGDRIYRADRALSNLI